MADFAGQCLRPIHRAPVRAVDPAQGASLGATYEEARWKKVTVTARELTPGTEPTITLKLKDSGLRWVVYDAAGFAPMFSQYSTKAGNVFTILPNGGWWREPERLWVGEGVEAAI